MSLPLCNNCGQASRNLAAAGPGKYCEHCGAEPVYPALASVGRPWHSKFDKPKISMKEAEEISSAETDQEKLARLDKWLCHLGWRLHLVLGEYTNQWALNTMYENIDANLPFPPPE